VLVRCTSIIQACRRAEGLTMRLDEEPLGDGREWIADGAGWKRQEEGKRAMKENYEDILSRLGKPDWWDWYGVPRYGEPTRVPKHLIGRIRCQHCAREFRVALVGVYIHNSSNIEQVKDQPDWEHFSHLALVEHWHYGDPPFHDCIGDTMNSVPEWEWAEFWDVSELAGG